MKTGNFTRRFLNKLVAPLILLIMGLSTQEAKAQCLPGYSSSRLDWDNLDYLVTAGSYNAYVPLALALTQNFAMGPNRVTITLSANIATGENTNNTGELANYTGADASFFPTANNQTITISFENEVMNASFSLYDIDRQQSIRVQAANALSIPLIPAISFQAGTILSVAGLPISPLI
jgi:hypothetical protein